MPAAMPIAAFETMVIFKFTSTTSTIIHSKVATPPVPFTAGGAFKSHRHG